MENGEVSPAVEAIDTLSKNTAEALRVLAECSKTHAESIRTIADTLKAHIARIKILEERAVIAGQRDRDLGEVEKRLASVERGILKLLENE